MIVAPLMVPILGMVVAVVLADRDNLIRCAGLVVAGALAVIAIAYVVGLLVEAPVVAATNSQVASRVTPNLIDLVAALATGAVGSVAIARDDISDTCPGSRSPSRWCLRSQWSVSRWNPASPTRRWARCCSSART